MKNYSVTDPEKCCQEVVKWAETEHRNGRLPHYGKIISIFSHENAVHIKASSRNQFREAARGAKKFCKWYIISHYKINGEFIDFPLQEVIIVDKSAIIELNQN
jgi:hypothetical protein